MARPSISFSEKALSDYASRLFLELEKHGCVITPVEIDKAVRRHSRLAELRPETLVRNIINIARVIGVLEVHAATILQLTPPLAYQRPEKVAQRLKHLAAYFTKEPHDLAKSVIKAHMGQLFVANPERVVSQIEAVARQLGVPVPTYQRWVVKHFRLARVSEKMLQKRLAEWHGVGFSQRACLAIITKRPDTLLKANMRTFVAELSRLLSHDRETVIALLVRCPALMLQRPATLKANLKATARELGVTLEEIKTASLHFPPLHYLAPDMVRRWTENFALALDAPFEETARALLRAPSLISRDLKMLSWRARLICRIAARRGEGLRRADIIRRWPNALIYGPERLLGCYLIAKWGLADRSWASLLLLNRAKITHSIDAWSEGCPAHQRVAVWRKRWVERGVLDE
ncbi:MAG: hypothetical protein ACLQJ0_11305 [Steroidobacteraceae bacterium]